MTVKTICSSLFVFIGCAAMASAQMTVHAMSGKLTLVHGGKIYIDTEGNTEQFTVLTGAAPSLQFPADLRADSTDAAKFEKTGDYVVVYYYGFGSDRTAVAVKDLGAGPFTKVHGTVVGYDKGTHVLTLKDDGGKELTLALTPALVVDEDNGLGSGKKFSPHKGDSVRVTYGAGSPPTVSLLREML